MFINDVMSRDVTTIPSSATVREAEELLAETENDLAVVIFEDVCCGIITLADLNSRVNDGIKTPEETFVAEVMSSGTRTLDTETKMNVRVAALPEDTEITQAIEFMDERHIRHVPVYDSEFCIVGVVTRSDLAKALQSAGRDYPPLDNGDAK